jgi:hypothetical protein
MAVRRLKPAQTKAPSSRHGLSLVLIDSLCFCQLLARGEHMLASGPKLGTDRLRFQL